MIHCMSSHHFYVLCVHHNVDHVMYLSYCFINNSEGFDEMFILGSNGY